MWIWSFVCLFFSRCSASKVYPWAAVRNTDWGGNAQFKCNKAPHWWPLPMSTLAKHIHRAAHAYIFSFFLSNVFMRLHFNGCCFDSVQPWQSHTWSTSNESCRNSHSIHTQFASLSLSSSSSTYNLTGTGMFAIAELRSENGDEEIYIHARTSDFFKFTRDTCVLSPLAHTLHLNELNDWTKRPKRLNINAGASTSCAIFADF